MIKNSTKLILGLLLFVFLSCEDEFLDKEPQNLLTQENFPSTAADALSATNAMYELLRQSTYHRGFFPIDDIMSDDARKGSNPEDQAAELGPFDSFEFTTTNGFVLNWWRTLYVGIRRTNVVINRVENVEMEQSLKNRYLGEAYFLRALHYADLARGYGGVPLVTSENPGTDLARSDIDQTYNLITGDLRKAIDFLPEKSNYDVIDLGRATKGAARALLSRVYLYKNQFDSAALYADEVINSGQYGLDNSFQNVFSVEGEHGIESIFEIGGIGDPGGIAAGSNQYALGQGVRGVPNRGFGFNRPSLDLISSFENGDERMDATVIFLGEVLDGVEIIGDPGTPDETFGEDGNLVERETYNQKIWVPGETVFSNQEHNRRVIRFAEVLLNAAEAHNEEGNTTMALNYLNQVRRRARNGNTSILPDITETAPDRLLDIILEERRHELAMEGFRFWDLVRRKKAVEILGPLGFLSNKHELLPIPQAEIDITLKKLNNNPGWE